MILTRDLLNEICEAQRWNIGVKLIDYLLDCYGEEPWPHTWSQQDLFEQIRKIVNLDENNNLDITVAAPLEKMTQKYERLKEKYVDLAREKAMLEKQLQDLAVAKPVESLSNLLPFD